RVDPPVERPDGRRDPVRRHRARRARRASDGERHARAADEPRVPRAVVPDASPRQGGLASGAERAHLRRAPRSRLEHRGSVRRAPPPKTRRRRDRDGARARVPHGMRRRAPMRSLRGYVMVGAALWTIGLLAMWAVYITFHRDRFEFLAAVHGYPHTLMLT